MKLWLYEIAVSDIIAEKGHDGELDEQFNSTSDSAAERST